MKIVVRAFIEMIIALIMTKSSYESYWAWVYCSGVFIMIGLRSVYSEYIDLTATIFVIMYIM